MNIRRHSTLARRLIDLCGGPVEAKLLLKDAGRKVELTLLSYYQLSHRPNVMPADIINILEHAAGKPVYSAALAEDVGCEALGEAVDAAMDLSEEALEMQKATRAAGADRQWSDREIDELETELHDVEESVRQLRAHIDQARASRPPLKAVS